MLDVNIFKFCLHRENGVNGPKLEIVWLRVQFDNFGNGKITPV